MVWIFSPPGVSSAWANSVRARARRVGRDRRRRLAELGERGAQVGVGEHRPGAEAGEEPALHLGGGGLGVGEAEDALRLGAGEQQPRHPVDQDPGLARAGVGGDPGRGVGAARPAPARASASFIAPPPVVGRVAVGPFAVARQVVVVAGGSSAAAAAGGRRSRWPGRW